MTRCLYKMLAMLMLGLLLIPLSAMAQQEKLNVVEVRILPQSEVQGERISLGEVAELDGFDLDVVKRLARVSLGNSPRPGEKTRLNAAHVRSNLYRAIPPERIHLVMPKTVWVTRSGQTIRGEEIAAMVRNKALALSQSHASGMQQTMIGKIKDAVLPMGSVEWEINPIGRYLSAGGSRMFRVAAKVNGKETWRTIVRMKQEITRQIVVALREIHRDKMIGADDVRLETHNVSGKKQERYVTRLEDVVGKRSRRAIGRGEWMHSRMVLTPSAVKEGGRVTIVYRTPRIFFEMPGVAMVKGNTGEFIPVRNLQSGKIVYGVVKNGSTIKVN